MSHLASAEAVDLLHQVGSWSPESIPLLVQGLCDPRQEVVQAAWEELQNLQHRWENQAWHQVVPSFVLLADLLLERKEDLSPHAFEYVRNLAQWILTWRPPHGSAQWVRILSSCEKFLASLNQVSSPSSRSVQTAIQKSSSGESVSPKLLPELIEPLGGFDLAGGGLPIELASKDSVPGPSASDRRSSGEAEGRIQHQAESLEVPGMNPSARSFGPTPLGKDSSGQGEIRDGAAPRANVPVRIGRSSSTGASGSEVLSETNSQGRFLGPVASLSISSVDSGSSAESERKWSRLGPVPGKSGAPPTIVSRRGEDLSQRGIRELLELLADAAPEDQQALQAELAQRGFGSVSRDLARRLCDPNPQVRLELVRRLPALAGVETVAWLFWLCDDPDPHVRSAARALLATTNDPAILRQLEIMLSRTPEDPLRRQTERLRAARQELFR